MLVSEEEHERHRVIQFVHLVEIFDLFQIANVDDCEVLDTVCDTVENFVLAHAVGVPVFTESDDDETFVFGHDGLVDVPTSDKVRKNNGPHYGVKTA